MQNEKVFQKRIGYTGELKLLLFEVCKDFGLGDYKSHRVITIGYEDLNIYVRTSTGSYLVKVLSEIRDKNEKLRYSEIIQEVVKAGIKHPKLYKSNQGYLHSLTLEKSTVYLFVMQFINGKSFYDLGIKPSKLEIANLSRQAAEINKINFKPTYVYDDWAIVNFVKEYEKIKIHLSKLDVDLIDPLISEFNILNLNSLPHCFVHGDMIDTNILKDNQGDLWIIDFSVSNYYPRIQELAVFSCNLFDQRLPFEFEDNYHIALSEYQKVITLTQLEIQSLPTFIKIAHAMHIIGSTRSKQKGEDTKENHHWLELGRQGLSYILDIWGQKKN